MTLSHYPTGLYIEITEQETTSLIIENTEVMADYVSDIKNLIEKDVGEFCLYDGDKEIKFSKRCELILDPWSIDYNSKRIKGKLYQLIHDIVEEQFYKDFLVARAGLYSFLEKVIEHVPYSTIYSTDLDMNTLSKMLDLKIDQGDNTVVERIVEYMKLMSSLCGVSVFFLVGIRAFISDTDMMLIYKEARYIGVILVIIESVERSYLEGEHSFIIDKDKCIIKL
ncbi:type II-A CRISPR-associated protein Csn2 [Lachnospiraceae bacterium C1.1]|nr:type II-A CRISPR-associated protein Csn2 [Lachnospiraceae bacterium C1.1]